MTRVARIAVISLAAIILVALTGVLIVQSSWFHGKVKARIVSMVEKAAGGRVEVGAYDFDWKTLTASITNLTIRGTEPPSGPPLLRVQSVAATIRIVTILKPSLDLESLRVKRPRASLLVAADGQTNLPAPRLSGKRNGSVQQILDLAIRRFSVEDGTIEVRAEGVPPKIAPWNAEGENLRSQMTYRSAGPSYEGTLAVDPVQFQWDGYPQLPASVNVAFMLEKNRLRITNSKVATTRSEVVARGAVDNFASPRAKFDYEAKLSAADAERFVKLKGTPSGTVQASGTATYSAGNPWTAAGSAESRDLAYAQPGMAVANVGFDAQYNYRWPDQLSVTGVAHAGNVHAQVSGVALRNARAEANFRFLGLDDYLVFGNFHAANVAAKGLPQASFDTKFRARPAALELTESRIAAAGGEILGGAEIRGMDQFRAEGAARNIDVRQAAALSSKLQLPWDGLISGTLEAHGSLKGLMRNDVIAAAHLTIQPAPKEEPVTGLIEAHYNGPRNPIDLGNSFLALRSTRLDFSGELGQRLQVRGASNNLNDLRPLMKTIPVELQNGTAVFNGTVTGPVSDPRVSGRVTVRNAVYSGQKITAASADLSIARTAASVQNGSVAYGNVRARFEGSAGLRDWKPANGAQLNASLSAQSAPVATLLALAGLKSIAATGALTGAAHVSGIVGNPRINADVEIARGSLFGEPFDRLTADLKSPDSATQSVVLRVTAGSRQGGIQAVATHPAADILPARLTFQTSSNDMPLAQFATVRRLQPGMEGNLRLKANGAAEILRLPSGSAAFRLADLNSDVSATGLKTDKKPLGDVHLTARTQASREGPVLTANLNSDLVQSAIRGGGEWRLVDNYPGKMQLAFTAVDLGVLRSLLLPQTSKTRLDFGGSLEGKIDVAGPALDPQAWTASLELPHVEVRPSTADAGSKRPPLALRNAEPVRLSMAKSILHVDSARFTGPETTISVSGTADLRQKQPLFFRVNGDLNLGLLHAIMPEVSSSGAVAANATIRGSLRDPLLAGRMTVKNANLTFGEFPNGLSNANGVVLFDGSRATIESLTASAGGGTVNGSGFVALAGGALVFRLEANATGVRVRYPEGVSTVADANLTLTGGTDRSVLAGNVTVSRIVYSPRTDLASLFTGAAAPVQTATPVNGALSGMQLDLQIQTAPDITFQTALAEGIQADANLRLRGTAAAPGLIGRIDVTQGDLAFFGTKYEIQDGTISFFNPAKIDPILNIDLETKARGVEVTLTVSGPVNKLNVSYRSDPPLQFSDIVALLATGRTPDVASLSLQRTGPPQSWQQMGASALIGQAIASPAAGRLQRFFGVSKLKVDPLLTGVTGNPQARITMEQQVTPDVTFTYVTDVTSTNPQIVRIEWALNRQWSVIAVRDENSSFGIDFLFKKRFK